MNPPGTIRKAVLGDLAAVEAIIAAAYARYIPRMGREPSTMHEDYRAHIAAGAVWAFEQDGSIAGLLVLLDADGYLQLDNIAVVPARQGQGIGRRLIAFAEAEARRRGYDEIRLTTNPHMTENIAMYGHLGYQETGRGREGVLEYVFFRKPLSDVSRQ